jgi:hypothetical protein
MNSEQPSIDDGYLILHRTEVVDKAKSYEEAMTKGKALKRSDPGSRVEIRYDGIAIELR